MKIKLINYNKTISNIGLNRVLIDAVKVIKPEETYGPELLEVLFCNESGTMMREFDLKEEIEDIISLVTACDIEIPEDFNFDPKLLLGKVLHIELVRDFGCSPHIESFKKINTEITPAKKMGDIELSANPFDDDDLPF
jgi:hypothetical protein